jgi:hypothetical protein
MQFTSRLLLTVVSIAVLASGMSVSLLQRNFHTEYSSSDDPRPLQVMLVRIVGYAIGTDIQGHFQLVVTGPANLTYITIHFNDTLVYNTTQSQFTWPFHTDNYPLGWITIQVQGVDSNDTHYAWSQLKRFVSSEVNTPYWMAALLFIMVFSILIIAVKVQQLHSKAAR